MLIQGALTSAGEAQKLDVEFEVENLVAIFVKNVDWLCLFHSFSNIFSLNSPINAIIPLEMRAYLLIRR